ncbi:nuclear transport factor 2 family protein [Desulfobotulus mexicanus]|uniref:Nuclear transport factor 2 family protein n=1 Tax=Desulfobotulus mexicanus TaxID=2586642 RepID=A0A5S5ME77_9BACT|nr:nuclear transport factor 2 family protein [Desulfobotulus mexicanus]TYT73935.1 nuclear transport factor 2 family protein [Desulfobotulus mexicanus]
MDEISRKKLEVWHDVVFNRNIEALESMLAEDVQFYSPALWKPKNTRMEAMVMLGTVIEVFENFTYHRELVQGNNWALEFSADVGEKSVKGIDLIEFNDEGKIQRFEVFIRPLTGLMALAEEMGKRLKEKGFI